MTRQAIETRYNFTLPEMYCQLEQSGRFSPANFNPAQPVQSLYLWLAEVEWWSLAEIANYQPPGHHKPGFVPFASDGAGDFWCWWPLRASGLGTPIALCPHDYKVARLDAPHFTGWLYRRILDYARGHIDTAEEAEARDWFKRWRTDLGAFFLPQWNETLGHLATAPLKTRPELSYTQQGFLNPEEYQAIIKRDLWFEGLDEKFEWMI